MGLTHLLVEVELVLCLAVVQPYPLVVSGRAALEIHGKLIPQILGNKVN